MIRQPFRINDIWEKTKESGNMKVSDGYWLSTPGYNVHYATQIYDIEADETSITVYVTDKWIVDRGFTLGGPILTIRFTSTLENCIKVTVSHFSGRLKKGPEFTKYEDSAFRPTVIQDRDGRWMLTSGKTSVKINHMKNSWEAVYRYDGSLLTKNGYHTTSIVEEENWHAEKRRQYHSDQRFYASHDTAAAPISVRCSVSPPASTSTVWAKSSQPFSRTASPLRHGTATAAPAPARATSPSHSLSPPAIMAYSWMSPEM